MKVTSSTGYLASISAVEEELGTTRCPWVLEAQPGRHWLVTVVAFGGDQSPTALINNNDIDEDQSESDAVGYGQHDQYRDACYDVGLVRDRQRIVRLQACGRRGRGRSDGIQYQSEASKVEVELLSVDIMRSFAPFLIKVEG